MVFKIRSVLDRSYNVKVRHTILCESVVPVRCLECSTGQIFMKFDIWVFFKIMSREFEFD
jgi:hypothetical protein